MFFFCTDSPKRWFLLHWLSFVTTVTGILTLLFARGHYSIDVLIAYWMTTRLWWIYHTLANNPSLVLGDNKYNYMSQFWWFCVFKYFEGNVGRPIPKGFNWPLPKRLKWRPSWSGRGRRSRRRHQTGSDDNAEEDSEPALSPEPQRTRPPLSSRRRERSAPQASVEDLESGGHLA